MKAEAKKNFVIIKRYELEKERLEDSLTRTRDKKNQLEEENKDLLTQKLILEDDFNQRIVRAMTTIQNLQHELKFCEEMNAAAKNSKKKSEESIKKSKSKAKPQEVDKLALENKQLKEKIKEMDKNHSDTIEKLQTQVSIKLL